MSEHDAYSIIIGVLNNLDSNGKMYDSNLNKWSNFFANNPNNYSLLSDISFDSDRGLSSFVYDVVGVLEIGALKKDSVVKRGAVGHHYQVNDSFVKKVFDRVVLEKFSESEKRELEDIAMDFENTFLLRD